MATNLPRILVFELPFLFVGDDFVGDEVGHFARINHYIGFEVEDPFQFPEGDVEEVADARRKALKKPDVRAGAGKLDVAEAFPANTGERHFDAALVADHTAVLHPLVLTAETLPVSYRAKDAGAEQAVPFRLEGPVVDGFRLGYFAVAPAANLLWRGQRDTDGIKIRD